MLEVADTVKKIELMQRDTNLGWWGATDGGPSVGHSGSFEAKFLRRKKKKLLLQPNYLASTEGWPQKSTFSVDNSYLLYLSGSKDRQVGWWTLRMESCPAYIFISSSMELSPCHPSLVNLILKPTLASINEFCEGCLLWKHHISCWAGTPDTSKLFNM